MPDPDDTDEAADPLQDRMDAAEHLARLVAGDDDRQFMVVFHSLVNVADTFAGPGAGGAGRARSILTTIAQPPASGARRGMRSVAPDRPAAAPPAAAAGDSIYSDAVYLENAKALIRDRRRIIGGIPTSDYPDCVAIGSDDDWCCTGTLVAPNVVVSAGHCVTDGCASRIFIGEDVTKKGTIIGVKRAVAHPDYESKDPTHDLAVLVLDKDAAIAPRAVGDDAMLESARSVRVAGFGYTDVHGTGGYGRCRMVDVPLASKDAKYGADARIEFVAGAQFLDRDSCNGDSGGPAYVRSNRKWYLAGATSRATDSTVRPCGDGGIYTRVNSFTDWVKSVPGGHWS